MEGKREKVILLVVLVASAAVALGAGTGIYLLQKKAGELQATNAALQSRVAQARSKLNRLPELRAQRESAQTRLEVAQSILPSQEEIENLVDNLAEFAKKSGVVITKAAPVRQGAYRAARGPVKRFEEADFDLDIEGDFFQFVEFLNFLENYKRFIRVDAFTVKAGRSQEEPHSVDLKFATFTYAQAPATPVAAALPVAAKGDR